MRAALLTLTLLSGCKFFAPDSEPIDPSKDDADLAACHTRAVVDKAFSGDGGAAYAEYRACVADAGLR